VLILPTFGEKLQFLDLQNVLGLQITSWKKNQDDEIVSNIFGGWSKLY